MKPYGVPRYNAIVFPDKEDARTFALKPALHSYAGKNGDDIRSNFKSAVKKQEVRRHFAKIDRNAGKQACKLEVIP